MSNRYMVVLHRSGGGFGAVSYAPTLTSARKAMTAHVRDWRAGGSRRTAVKISYDARNCHYILKDRGETIGVLQIEAIATVAK